MFCTRCGKENRDDASFCTQCGGNLGQAPLPPLPQKPPGVGKTPWIIGGIVLAVTLIIMISAGVYAFSAYRNTVNRRVIIEGRTLVGADGEPIELYRNPDAKDATWAELKQFLLTDQTDRIRYREGTFVCADFAETLFNNAEKSGIKAGYVFVEFEIGTEAHACNAFRTTDRGLFYVDDTGTISGTFNADKTVDIADGELYCPEPVFGHPGDDGAWECLGVVSDFCVIW